VDVATLARDRRSHGPIKDGGLGIAEVVSQMEGLLHDTEVLLEEVRTETGEGR
jgi:hypothetical protein